MKLIFEIFTFKNFRFYGNYVPLSEANFIVPSPYNVKNVHLLERTVVRPILPSSMLLSSMTAWMNVKG